MNTIATMRAGVQQTLQKCARCVSFTLPAIILLSACTNGQLKPVDNSDSTGPLYLLVPSNQEAVLPDPATPTDPEDFALDLVKLMGTSPGKCGVEAKNSPQVNWVCAEYTKGLSTFIAKWDKLIQSAEVSLNHTYSATSDWMYFEIDGEIDFFWKTYDLHTTQALVAYDPSEPGNELIIGLYPDIGTRMAAANGSHLLTTYSQLLPVQE